MARILPNSKSTSEMRKSRLALAKNIRENAFSNNKVIADNTPSLNRFGMGKVTHRDGVLDSLFQKGVEEGTNIAKDTAISAAQILNEGANQGGGRYLFGKDYLARGAGSLFGDRMRKTVSGEVTSMDILNAANLVPGIGGAVGKAASFGIKNAKYLPAMAKTEIEASKTMGIVPRQFRFDPSKVTEYTMDPRRISDSAQQLSDIGKSVIESGFSGSRFTAKELRELGYTGDPRDIYPITTYGTFEPLQGIDLSFLKNISMRDPESVVMSWDTPVASARRTFSTLRDPLRFPFTLTKEQLGTLLKQKQRELVRGIERGKEPSVSPTELNRRIKEETRAASIPELRRALAGEFPRSRSGYRLSDEDATSLYDRYSRLMTNLTPDLVLPERFMSRIKNSSLYIPGSQQGEHTVFPAGAYGLSLGKIFSNTKNMTEDLLEQVPPLTETVQGDIGVRLPKTLNQLFASGARTVDGEISEESPAFLTAAKTLPIAFDRFKQAGGLGIYGEDLSRAETNAEKLSKMILSEIEGMGTTLERRRRVRPYSPYRD